MAIHKRRFNHNTALIGSAQVPAATGDRYWGQDLMRDNQYLRGLVGRMMQKLTGSSSMLLSGGVVTEGSSKTKVNITAAAGCALTNITVGDDDAVWAVPQATETAQIPVLVESDAQTDFDISGATLDGVTVNYIKLRYKDLTVNTRTKKYKVESFAFSIADSFEIIANSTAPNDYDVVLASFVGNGTSTLTITQAGTAIVPRATSAVSAGTAASCSGNAATATLASNSSQFGGKTPAVFRETLAKVYDSGEKIYGGSIGAHVYGVLINKTTAAVSGVATDIYGATPYTVPSGFYFIGNSINF